MLQFVFLQLAVYAVSASHQHRQEQLSRMKQYSLLSLSPEIVDDHRRLLEFVAFEQHYVVELTRKTNWAPSTVRHSNVEEAVHGPLSAVEESCHFGGRVLNDAGDSVVSASLCDGRGLRARISAFGETLIVRPSAYFMDLEADKMGNHSLADEVLVYRLSDFQRPAATLNAEKLSASQMTAGGESAAALSDEALRRRLYSASNPAQTEVAVMIGPVRTANYKADYGDNWYIQLFGDTADMMNSVDEIYKNTNWNLGTRQSVGGRNSLRVVMSEIYVVYSFEGIHSSLEPEKRFYSCPLPEHEYDDSNECAVDGDDWLDLIQQWIGNNMDVNDYDNVQFITDMMFDWTPCGYDANAACGRTLGWGSVGEVCRGSRSSAISSVVPSMGGNSFAVGTIAHELGHNFGLRHDGQPGPASTCCADCGLMGYGSNHFSFSGCSLNLMEQYFNGDGAGLFCLNGADWDGTTMTNVDDGQSGNPSPTAAPTFGPGGTTAAPPVAGGCLNVAMGLENYDGTWSAIEGGHDGHEAYSFVNAQGATKYLYHKQLGWTTNAGSTWAISETLGGATYVNLICSNENLYECSSHWKPPGGDVIADSVTDYQCDAGDAEQEQCDSRYSRICVAGSGPYGAYDGYYDAAGCFNGTRFYNGSRGNYLCYDSTFNHVQWTITWGLCSRGNIASQPTTADAGVLDPAYWMYSSYGNSYHNLDDDMMVWDCSHLRNSALNGDDLSCLDEKAYGDEICVSNPNHSLWAGSGSDRTFKLYTKLCSNGEPIYHFVQYNDSKSLLLPSGEVLSAEVEATFYVHFEMVYPTVTDNETVGQWRLSRDGMDDHHRIAFCEEEELTECTSNRWKVKVTERGVDGTIFHSLDAFTSVLDGHCDSQSDDELAADPERWGLASGVVIGIAFTSTACLALFGVVAICAWRRLKYQQYRTDALRIEQAALDAEEHHAVRRRPDGQETAEISVECVVDEKWTGRV